MKSIIRPYLIFGLLLPISLFAAPEGSDRANYINTWKEVAVEQMHLHGIPASITMAQAILESGNGKSMLATTANNHFGIKCHGWSGPGVKRDDDKKNECFRKYRNAQESFDDHSLFLKKKRYAFLFDYDITDYKSWAKGLKKAGYATDPSYAKRLIDLIEKNDLDKLDRAELFVEAKSSKRSEARYEKKQDTEKEIAEIDITLAREVRTHTNRIKYIEAKAGESIVQIAEDMDMAPWQIRKYNDVQVGHTYTGGETVFVQPKKNKSKKAHHLVKDGETLTEISQFYGVKLKKLKEYNGFSSAGSLTSGKKILLRKPR